MGKYDDAIGGGKIVLNVDEVLNEESAKKVDRKIKKQKEKLSEPVAIQVDDKAATTKLEALDDLAKSIKKDLNDAIASKKSLAEVNKLLDKYQQIDNEVKSISANAGKNNKALQGVQKTLRETKQIIDSIAISEEKITKTRKKRNAQSVEKSVTSVENKPSVNVTTNNVGILKSVQKATESVVSATNAQTAAVEEQIDAQKRLREAYLATRKVYEVVRTRRGAEGQTLQDSVYSPTEGHAKAYVESIQKINGQSAEIIIKSLGDLDKKTRDNFEKRFYKPHLTRQGTRSNNIFNLMHGDLETYIAMIEGREDFISQYKRLSKLLASGKNVADIKPSQNMLDQFGWMLDESDSVSEDEIDLLERILGRRLSDENRLKGLLEYGRSKYVDSGTWGAMAKYYDRNKPTQQQAELASAIEETADAIRYEIDVTEDAAKAKQKYYDIDEEAAKRSKQMRSFDDYKEGSATASYRASVDALAAIVEEKKKQFPDKSEQLDQWLDRYAKNLAQYINRDNQIGAQYPSVMISGAGNYNIKKHNRQMASWGKNYKFYEDSVLAIESKIKNLGESGSEVIRGDEEDALERLEAKLEFMKYWHDVMVEANKYYRKYKTLDGFDGAEPDEIERIKQDLAEQKRLMGRDIPYPQYALTNDNQSIKRIEGRIAELKRLKSSDGSSDALAEENEIYKLWADKEAMRIRIEFYMDRVDNEIYQMLKKKAFKHTPSLDGDHTRVFQRQLTDNAVYDTKRIKESLHEYYNLGAAQQQLNGEIAETVEQRGAEADATEQVADAQKKLSFVQKKDNTGRAIPGVWGTEDGKFEAAQNGNVWDLTQRDNIGTYNLIGTYKTLQEIRDDATLATRDEIVYSEQVVAAVRELQDAYSKLPVEIGKNIATANKYSELLGMVKDEAISAADAIAMLHEHVGIKPQQTQEEKQVRTLEQVNEELEVERAKLKEIEKLQEANDRNREAFARKKDNYGKEVLCVDHAVYDRKAYQGAIAALDTFNVKSSRRNELEAEYLKIKEAFSRYYVGRYGIGQEYGSFDDFVAKNKNVNNAHFIFEEKGIKNIRASEISTDRIKDLLNSLISELHDSIVGIRMNVNDGYQMLANIYEELDTEEIALNQEMQRLYDQRIEQEDKISRLRNEELELIRLKGKEERKVAEQTAQASGDSVSEKIESNKKLTSSYEGLAEAVELYYEAAKKMTAAYRAGSSDAVQLRDERNNLLDQILTFLTPITPGDIRTGARDNLETWLRAIKAGSEDGDKSAQEVLEYVENAIKTDAKQASQHRYENAVLIRDNAIANSNKPVQLPAEPVIEQGAPQAAVNESINGTPVEVPAILVADQDADTRILPADTPLLDPIDDRIEESVQQEQQLLSTAQQVSEEMREQADAAKEAANNTREQLDAERQLDDIEDDDDESGSKYGKKDKPSIIQKQAEEAFAQLRNALGNKDKYVDLSDVHTYGDLEKQIGDMVKNINIPGLTLKNVIVKDDIARISLWNEELGISIAQVYKLQKVGEEAKASLKFVSDFYQYNPVQQGKYTKKQAEKIAQDDRWLVSQLSKLDTQDRRANASNKKLAKDTKVGAIDETSLEDQADVTINALTEYIKNRINNAFGKGVSQELRTSIMNDLRVLENEIKVAQYDQYAAREMQPAQVEEARQELINLLNTLEAKSKRKNVFEKVSADIEKLRNQLTKPELDGYAKNGSDISSAAKVFSNLQSQLTAEIAMQDAQIARYKEIFALTKKLNEAKLSFKSAYELGEDSSVYAKQIVSYRQRISDLKDGANLTTEQELELERQNVEYLKKRKDLLEDIAKKANEAKKKEAKQEQDDIKSLYSRLLNSLKQGNTVDSQINDLVFKNVGTADYSKTIMSKMSQRMDIGENYSDIIEEIGKRFNIDIGESGWMTEFFNIAIEKAALTTDELQKLTDAFRQSNEIGFNFGAQLSEKVQPTIDKLKELVRLSQDGVVKDQDVSKNISYMDVLMDSKLLQFQDNPSALNGMDLLQYVNGIKQYIDQLDIAIQKEQQYFAGKTKYTQDTTMSSMANDAQKAATEIGTVRQELTQAANEFAQASNGTNAIITNFVQTADGISKLDFSVFDKTTNSMRTFTLEMGNVTQGMYVAETGMSKSMQNMQKAQKQLEAIGDLISRLGAADIDINEETTSGDIKKLLGVYKELQNVVNSDGNVNQADLLDIVKRSKLSAAEVEKLYKKLIALEEFQYNGGTVIGLKGVDKSADYDTVFQQLTTSIKKYADANNYTVGTIGKLNEKTGQLKFTLIGSDGLVREFTVDLKTLGREVKAQETSVTEYQNIWQRLGNSLKITGKQFASAVVGVNVFNKALSELRKGYQYVREIDTALTELKKVTNESELSYKKFLKTMSQYGREVSSTMSALTTSAADWARLGYSMEDAGILAKNTSILMNVSEFDNVSEATDTLISALQAYKDEGSDVTDLSMKIIDAYNTVGNKFAISTSDLANSLTRSSAALVAANNDLAESIALTTAANTTIQDPEAVGKKYCRH